MTRLGQLIHRRARLGGALFVAGSVQFILAMVAVQAAYPGYSVSANHISDLGNAQLSPWAEVFNLSIRALGVLGMIGTLLVPSAFARRASARFGLVLLAVASAGAFLVGTFPATSTELNGNIHGYVSDLTFFASGLALLGLGYGMLGDVRWELYGLYSVLSGLVTFAAIAGFLAVGGAAQVGIWERLVVAPILLWSIVAGAHIVGLPAYPRMPRLALLH